MTSTIAPDKNALSLEISSKEIRLEQYKTALLFYIGLLQNSNTLDKIIYVDNSDHDLTELRAIADECGVKDKIEFISYKSLLDASKNGRFYLEINLIDRAFSCSKIIKEHPDAVYWKISGRYIINNFEKILDSCSKDSQYLGFFNCRNIPHKWTDFFLAGFKPALYNELFKNQLEIFAGNTDGEIELRKLIDHKLQHSTIKKRLPFTPYVTGTRGYDGEPYNKGKNLIKYYIRSSCNKLLPFIWI